MENNKTLQIAIIGGGFCGVMTAIHLMKNDGISLHIHIVNKGNPIAKGVAFNPHTSDLLLNVPNGKISAFADAPDHFSRWLKANNLVEPTDEEELVNGFSTREQYGYYLTHVWHDALNNKSRNISVTVIDDEAYDMVEDGSRFHIYFKHHAVLTTDFVVLATGNTEPRLPSGIPSSFSASKHYYNNPWKRDCIENLNTDHDVLIIGNGLTMADTVIGLAENGFKKSIYTISPHGYNLNPSKDTKPTYTGTDIDEILNGEIKFIDLVKSLNRHRKIAESLNHSVYHIIDSLRPYNQKIWQAISHNEKLQFIKYLRHLWGSIRHRLPAKMHSFVEEMYKQERLFTYKGRVTNIMETDDVINVTLNCGGSLKNLTVQRIINCTGPEGSLRLSANELLRNLEKNGVICADDLNMGINARPDDGCVITQDGKCKPNLFVIGTNLKGVLWESTAVPELRMQAKKLAENLIAKCYNGIYRPQDA